MNVLQALVLGLLQGATEFIPISSSGHLTLVPWLFGWTFDPTFKGAFDVLAHWGTLLALLAVFWRELWGFVLGWLRTLGVGGEDGREDAAGHPAGGRAGGWLHAVLRRVEGDVEGRLAWLILIGSIPAALAGVLFEDFFEMLFGTPRLVSLLLLVTAALLALSEWRGRQGRDLPALAWFDALIVGLGQATAIAPGISRSGATMAAGLLRGVRRDAAARFSFLLSAPVILGAGVWQLKDLLASRGWTVSLGALLVGFLASALAGYLCIRFLLSYLRRGKLYPFALYCALAGIFCFILSTVR